eukprot:Rhum_TRINITY_DN14847_c13_g2::Rhum_TRINITY_DN14847_c13_g2_i1::g.125736::m.125736
MDAAPAPTCFEAFSAIGYEVLSSLGEGKYAVCNADTSEIRIAFEYPLPPPPPRPPPPPPPPSSSLSSSLPHNGDGEEAAHTTAMLHRYYAAALRRIVQKLDFARTTRSRHIAGVACFSVDAGFVRIVSQRAPDECHSWSDHRSSRRRRGRCSSSSSGGGGAWEADAWTCGIELLRALRTYHLAGLTHGALAAGAGCVRVDAATSEVFVVDPLTVELAALRRPCAETAFWPGPAEDCASLASFVVKEAAAAPGGAPPATDDMRRFVSLLNSVDAAAPDPLKAILKWRPLAERVMQGAAAVKVGRAVAAAERRAAGALALEKEERLWRAEEEEAVRGVQRACVRHKKVCEEWLRGFAD